MFFAAARAAKPLLGALAAFVLLTTATPAQATRTWEPWRAIPDGFTNGTDIGVLVGSDGYGNTGDHTVHFRFRNRYQEPVVIRVYITLATASGPHVDPEELPLQPGQVDASGGHFSVGSRVTAIQLKRIQFGYPNARAVFEDGRQTCCRDDDRAGNHRGIEPGGGGQDAKPTIRPHPAERLAPGGVRGDAGNTPSGLQVAAAAQARRESIAAAQRAETVAKREAEQGRLVEHERERQADIAALQAEARRNEVKAQSAAAMNRNVAASVNGSVSSAVTTVFGAVDGAGAVARDNARADQLRAQEAASIRAAGDARALRAHAEALRSDAEDAERNAKQADELADTYKNAPSSGGLLGGILGGVGDRMEASNRSKAAAYRERASDLRTQADALEREAANMTLARGTADSAAASGVDVSSFPAHVVRNPDRSFTPEAGYHWVDPTARNDLRVEPNAAPVPAPVASAQSPGSSPASPQPVGQATPPRPRARTADELLILAREALGLGDAASAETYSRQAIGLNSTNQTAWLTLVSALTRQGRDTATILRTYEDAIVVANFAPAIRLAYAQLLDARGRREDARRVISDGLRFGESAALRSAAADYAADTVKAPARPFGADRPSPRP
jgi:hypothetical protein